MAINYPALIIFRAKKSASQINQKFISLFVFYRRGMGINYRDTIICLIFLYAATRTCMAFSW